MTAKEALNKWTEIVGDSAMGKEIKYWVIKNPDAGLYYRGKGENRWGKYYNQASIFRIRGQVEESCKYINRYGRNGERAAIVEIKITEVVVEDE